MTAASARAPCGPIDSDISAIAAGIAARANCLDTVNGRENTPSLPHHAGPVLYRPIARPC